MKSFFILFAFCLFSFCRSEAESSKEPIETDFYPQSFIKLEDLAEYGGSDYANAVRIERGISLEKAFEIASQDPEIDYFFYVKGISMVLCCNHVLESEEDPLGLITYEEFLGDDGERHQGYVRVFTHGDVVFFANEDKRWSGSAYGLADTYIKKSKHLASHTE